MEPKKEKFNKRKRRTTYRLNSNASKDRIRVSFNKSNKYLSLQAIDPTNGMTLVSYNTGSEKHFKELKKRKSTESANKVGSLIAEFLKSKIKDKSIRKIYFDRGGFQYHGIAKVCAESLRNNGLEF